MLVQLGQRRAPERLVDLLAECHLRIRTFLGHARQLPIAEGISDDEVRAMAGGIRRYFATAFPMHLEDEDEDIAPRLIGTRPDVDAALAAMSADHVSHAADIGLLVDVCGVLERDPRQRGAVSTQLAALAATLTASLDAHLELEERVIFPALATLPPDVQGELLLAMRARRERAMGSR